MINRLPGVQHQIPACSTGQPRPSSQQMPYINHPPGQTGSLCGRKAPRVFRHKANAKSMLFHSGRPFLATLLQKLQRHCLRQGWGIGSHPDQHSGRGPGDESFNIMFIVYPHEWRELASASATCAHRTTAQIAASPESPAVHRSLERRGWGRPGRNWGGQV